MTPIWTIKPSRFAALSFGLLAAWACTVVDKGDYTFTDNPAEGGQGASSGDGSGAKGGTSGKAGTSSGATGGKGGSAGKGTTGGSAGEAGVGATGGTGGSAGKGGVGGKGGSAGKGGVGGKGGTGGDSGAGQGGVAPTGDCGNGDIDAGEDCDLGVKNGVTTCTYGQMSCTVCTADCKRASGTATYCGDTKKQSSHEECDDGNQVNEVCAYGDASCLGCTTACKSTSAYCGDGKANAPAVTQIKLEYLGLWGGCAAGVEMPFYLNDVLMPGAPQGYCYCPYSTIQSVVITDAKVLAAVRPDNNVLELRGIGDVYWTYLSWARLTFSFSGLPDVVVTPIDPFYNAGGTDLCDYLQYGAVTGVPFGVTPAEQCDGGSGCASCATILPASCADILADDSRSADGIYRIDPTGGAAKDARSVYCDMTDGGITYESLGFGQWNQAYSGYTGLSLTDMQNTQIQRAFVELYNLQRGVINLSPGWVSESCCFQGAGGSGYDFLTFGGDPVFPADAEDYGAQYHCNSYDETYATIGNYNESLMRFARYGGHTVVPAYDPTTAEHMTRDFFTTFPVGSTYICSSLSNPGFFMKSY